MADGAGDVAFVKHTTTAEVLADGQYGSLNDYEYLCKDGRRMGKTVSVSSMLIRNGIDWVSTASSGNACEERNTATNYFKVSPEIPC